MSDQKKHITYSLEDIEQYLQGKLSPAEMHELEKAAVQDPFLADAIDGYQSADLSVVKNDLDVIRDTLSSGPAKIIPVTSNFIAWWKIAAAVILVAGAGTIGWKLLSDQKNLKQELAVLQVPVTQLSKDTVPSQQLVIINQYPASAVEKKDSPAVVEKRTVSSNTVSAASLPGKKIVFDQEITSLGSLTIPGTTSVQKDVSERNKLSIDSTSLDETVIVSPPIDKKQFIRADTVEFNASSFGNNVGLIRPNPGSLPQGRTTGRVLGGTSNPSNLAKEFAGNRVTGQFQLKNGDTFRVASTATELTNLGIFSAITAVGGYFQVQFRDAADIQKIKAVQVWELSDSHKQISFVLDTASDNKMFPMLLTLRKADTTNDQELLEPVTGWKDFTNYLRKKILSEKKGLLAVAGKIEVILETDREGKITAANIVRTFDRQLNPIVLDAIRNGPRWMRSGKTIQVRTQVTIKL